MTPLTILASAQVDVLDIVAWYDSVQPGLGDRFVAEFKRTLAQTEWNPRLFARVHGVYRAALVNRFPYVVYYRVETNGVLVRAVIHTRRSLRYRRSRLS